MTVDPIELGSGVDTTGLFVWEITRPEGPNHKHWFYGQVFPAGASVVEIGAGECDRGVCKRAGRDAQYFYTLWGARRWCVREARRRSGAWAHHPAQVVDSGWYPGLET